MLMFIYRIQEGLQTLGILSTIKEHPQTFKDLFVCQGNDKLTAEIMEVVFMDIKMSVPGCNKRRDEERVVGYWRDFLIDLQGTPACTEDLGFLQNSTFPQYDCIQKPATVCSTCSVEWVFNFLLL